ncbi:hypothetical protein ATKI12_6511 [Kitasatospora sp. Ki12]
MPVPRGGDSCSLSGHGITCYVGAVSLTDKAALGQVLLCHDDFGRRAARRP